MLDNHDAPQVTWGMRYCVPVVPDSGWWATVSIDTEKLAGISGKLYLIRERDAFTTEEEEISLGLWTKGEGRLSMAGALGSWIASQDTEKCVWSGHGYKEEMQCQQLAKTADNLMQKSNRWTIAYYGCCLYCWAGRDTAQQNATTNFNASTYGIDVQTVGNGNFNTARSQTIHQQLQSKYGNRTVILDLPNWNFHG